MKWVGLSSVLFPVLLAVFLFSISSPVYSEEKADITKSELMTLLNEREFLKTELSNLSENYKMLDLKYLTLEEKYKTLELDLQKLKIESVLRMDSLTTLKKEIAWNDVKWLLAGFGLGFAGGNYTGIKIGVTISP